MFGLHFSVPVVVTVVGSAAAASATLTDLGTLPGDVRSTATAVSSDGLTVTGTSVDASGIETGYRWTLGGGMLELSPLAIGDDTTVPMGLSFDGSIAVGFSSGFGSLAQAVRWAGTVPVSLGDLPTTVVGLSEARAVGGDGMTIVGLADACACGLSGQAYAWTKVTGMNGLGWLDVSAIYSAAYGISSDGTVIVGESDNALGRREAFRWTAVDGMQGLGDLPGGLFSSRATAVSADGRKIIGSGLSEHGVEAFVWDEEVGMVVLVDPPGAIFGSEALDLSDDGSTIVGQGATDAAVIGLIWRDGATRSLASILAEHGVDLTGWHIMSATGVSADGRTVVGNGVHDGEDRAFIARIDPVCRADVDRSGSVGFSDLAAVLSQWGVCDECPEDLDGDGGVGFVDLAIVLNDWGPC